MSTQINQIASLLNEMGMDKDDIGEVIELINDILEGNNYDEECSDDDISDDDIEDLFPTQKQSHPSQPSRPSQQPPPKPQSRPQTAPPPKPRPETAPPKPSQNSVPKSSHSDSSSTITSIKGSSQTLSMSKVMDCIPVGGGVQTLVNRFVDFCKSKNIDPESARKVINTKLGKRTKIVDVNLYVEGSVTTSDIIGCLKK